MKYILLSVMAAMSLYSVAAIEKCGSKQSARRHMMQVTVDKIDNNNSDGVSRVTCTLLGVPHTSSRIDSVTAIVNGRSVKATDIDGVDFGRYFQWEDERDFPVDVDIKRHSKYAPTDSIYFHTVHGVYSAPLINRK